MTSTVEPFRSPVASFASPVTLSDSSRRGSIGRGSTPIHAQDRWYDPAVLTALDAQLLDEAAEFALRAMTVRLADLRIGMELLEDVITTDDRLVVVGAGTAITGAMLERLHNFARIKGIREPIVIKRPDAFLSGFDAA